MNTKKRHDLRFQYNLCKTCIKYNFHNLLLSIYPFLKAKSSLANHIIKDCLEIEGTIGQTKINWIHSTVGHLVLISSQVILYDNLPVLEGKQEKESSPPKLHLTKPGLNGY